MTYFCIHKYFHLGILLKDFFGNQLQVKDIEGENLTSVFECHNFPLKQVAILDWTESRAKLV